MSDIKISQLPAATSVSSSEIVLMNNNGVTKSSPISYLPTGANNGEYTINFEDMLQKSLASKKYESSGYNNYKKAAMYMKNAIKLAVTDVHEKGGGTILFEKLYWL